MAEFLKRLRSIKLIWKLLFPFLLLSFLGNAAIAYIGLNSQLNMIKKEEMKEILNFYHLFMSKMDYTKKQALSLATTFAENSQIRSLMANRDRNALSELLVPMFHTLKKEFEIAQFHFHTPDGNSLLRLHRLEEFGESVDYRKMIIDVMKTGKSVAGLERGLVGLGIRGVAPVFQNNLMVGTVEIGYSFEMDFLQDLKLKWGPDFTVYEKNGDHTYICLATTLKYCDELRLVHYLTDSEGDEPTIVIAPQNYPDKSFTLGYIRDYGGDVVALVKIEKDRSEIITRLNNTRNLMLLVVLSGIMVSFVIIWFVSSQFTKPIREIVKEAQEIADEKRETHLESRPDDEIGLLTRSLNSMLESLKQRRLQIESYAKTLEKKVEERTADLISSEEKYRTLVEHLPLIVYRLLDDGTAELINSYFNETLGYSVDEVVGDKTFWWKKIYGMDIDKSREFISTFWENRKDFRTKREVLDKAGNPFVFIDRMIPVKNDFGKVKWVDGIMIDITELNKLQEKSLQTEEIRVLGEISARFAHEIRNPLMIVGGFARRLQDSLPKNDKNGNLARIIVKEVSRLEQILRIMLTSIQPVTLCIEPFDINHLLQSLLKELDDIIAQKMIRVDQSLSAILPKLHGDEGLLNRSFLSLIKHAISSMNEKEKLFLSTDLENSHIIIIIKYKEEGFLKEDLDQYFFPRFTNNIDNPSEELPLSKVIIYRHGGKIVVSEEKGSVVVIRTELPIRQQHEP